MTGKLTAVEDVEMLDLHPHEDVVVQLLNVGVADLEVADEMLLTLQFVAVNLEINMN